MRSHTVASEIVSGRRMNHCRDWARTNRRMDASSMRRESLMRRSLAGTLNGLAKRRVFRHQTSGLVQRFAHGAGLQSAEPYSELTERFVQMLATQPERGQTRVVPVPTFHGQLFEGDTELGRDRRHQCGSERSNWPKSFEAIRGISINGVGTSSANRGTRRRITGVRCPSPKPVAG